MLLGVSESWVRRHIAELPAHRTGRLIRIDASALLQQTTKNPLKPERQIMPNRYQRGFVRLRGKTNKVWYGIFREDVRTPDGIQRPQRQVRLGTLIELPTKFAARNKLAELMSGKQDAPAQMDMLFRDLVERWKAAEGPTIKESSFRHYSNALRIYVVPEFGDRKIAEINRADIQTFLNDQAKTYSTSTLRSMRVVLGLTLGWAESCGWLEKNPCEKIKLPKQTGGRRVRRTVLSPEQVAAVASNLEEPYATLVLLLFVTGLRIGEASALKWTDLQGNVLTVSRRIYEREIGEVKSLSSVRKLVLGSDMVARIGVLHSRFANSEWIFQSEVGTPIDPRNALNRYFRPAAAACGITVSGWHDFRHTLSTNLRRNKQHPKVISDILGHSKVNLAMDVYDRTDLQDVSTALATVSQLLPNVAKSAVVQ
jgi:integrase